MSEKPVIKKPTSLWLAGWSSGMIDVLNLQPRDIDWYEITRRLGIKRFQNHRRAVSVDVHRHICRRLFKHCYSMLNTFGGFEVCHLTGPVKTRVQPFGWHDLYAGTIILDEDDPKSSVKYEGEIYTHEQWVALLELYILWHDGHEAFVGDNLGPVKQYFQEMLGHYAGCNFDAFYEIENSIDTALFGNLGVPVMTEQVRNGVVKLVDILSATLEFVIGMDYPYHSWGVYLRGPQVRLGVERECQIWRSAAAYGFAVPYRDSLYDAGIFNCGTICVPPYYNVENLPVSDALIKYQRESYLANRQNGYSLYGAENGELV